MYYILYIWIINICGPLYINVEKPYSFSACSEGQGRCITNGSVVVAKLNGLPMPQRSIYIREEDDEKWQAIKKKSEFIHEALNKTVSASGTLGGASFDKILSDFPDGNYDPVVLVAPNNAMKKQWEKDYPGIEVVLQSKYKGYDLPKDILKSRQSDTFLEVGSKPDPKKVTKVAGQCEHGFTKGQCTMKPKQCPFSRYKW